MHGIFGWVGEPSRSEPGGRCDKGLGAHGAGPTTFDVVSNGGPLLVGATYEEFVRNVPLGPLSVVARASDGFYMATKHKPIWHLRNAFSSTRFDNAVRLPPYSTAHMTRKGVVRIDPIARTQGTKAVVVCSGGIDSACAASIAKREHGEILLLHYDYQCRATTREWECVQKLAAHFACPCVRLPLQFWNSTLLDPSAPLATKVGSAHEWVPARNLVMLSVAVSYAEAHGYGHVYIGTILESSVAYPDSEAQWTEDFDAMLYGALGLDVRVSVHAPLAKMMKADVVSTCAALGTPTHLTWSCYQGGEKHCGVCTSCITRRTGWKDTVEYDSTSVN